MNSELLPPLRLCTSGPKACKMIPPRAWNKLWKRENDVLFILIDIVLSGSGLFGPRNQGKGDDNQQPGRSGHLSQNAIRTDYHPGQS